MAGDWIKMRGNLWDDPRVSGLCDQTGAQEAAIIGGLYWLWTTADQHTEDGVLPGMTLRAIDRKTGIESFGQALVSIGWINELDDGILICRFDEHNGTSAKRRCMEAQRKANSRKLSANNADITPTENGQGRTDCGAREEKRREDISTTDVVDKRKSATPARPDDVSQSVWDDFLAIRKAKKSPLSPTALHGIEREAAKAGLSLEAALSMCCSRGWQSFKADWVKKDGNAGQKQTTRNGAAMASYGTIFPTTQEGQGNGRTIDATPRLG